MGVFLFSLGRSGSRSRPSCFPLYLLTYWRRLKDAATIINAFGRWTA